MGKPKINLSWPIDAGVGRKMLGKSRPNTPSSHRSNERDSGRKEAGFGLRGSKIGGKGVTHRRNLAGNRRSAKMEATGFLPFSGDTGGSTGCYRSGWEAEIVGFLSRVVDELAVAGCSRISGEELWPRGYGMGTDLVGEKRRGKRRRRASFSGCDAGSPSSENGEISVGRSGGTVTREGELVPGREKGKGRARSGRGEPKFLIK